MSTEPEPEGLLGSALAVQVERVGVWEDFFISVAGLGGGDDAFASLNKLYEQLVKLILN